MALNIVLFEPEIPNNTGNIGRLALGTGCNLHLVKPYGFEISDKKLKRAGLDYWPHINLTEYDSVEDFFAQHGHAKFAFFSSKGERSFWEIPYEDDLFLVFGKESKGLDDWITEKYAKDTYQIPMFSDKIRSFNIANAVAIAVYEGIRNLK
ncbi:tRNA (cytidine(34)-2'-O)-methyltransferase [Lishizhenia sp.]|uniref:tRNA (cytidine(34)-2'-O)-methyltransferase n=1 Tax=Lishizhenia sp. TaxID=2497594 RepID=UPI00299DAAD4|nr:tRNA (cytidine(34)-2'-O)-methyltransferase [Lishizhenia sp.]MDX1446558.1 tRNA (cytidine(34)-2'-O)-methyltransferase [Lishizhenia sp.]